MTKTEAKAILRRAFSALTARQRGRLREHAKRQTRVLCEQRYQLYADGEGG